MPSPSLSRAVENRLFDSPTSRFWRELFSNSGQFPIAILLLEFLAEGREYLTKPDLYILIPAAMLQAYFLSRRPAAGRWEKFFGNLIALALYTVVETSFEGMEFFAAPHHFLFLVFAFLIGMLQALQSGRSGWVADSLLIVENLLRAEILFALYVVFETIANPAQTVSMAEFFADTSHQFIGLATLLLGISVGLANANSQRYLNLLKQTASQLQTYSEWLLGRDLLGRAINDPNSMRLSRQKRTILFMDIRGFTGWSEKRSPEEVAALLNHYYMSVESLLNDHQVIKFKFTADEVMVVFLEADEALRSARELRNATSRILSKHGLGVGIGIHTGLLVEGLLGGQNIRFYDVIGDTVNTAQRIEKIASSGEIWISEDTRQILSTRETGHQKDVSVSGKEQPLKIHSV